MKALSKSLSTLFTLLFCVGAIWSAYTLYMLPANLMEYSKSIDLIQIRQVYPLLNHLYLTLGTTLASGMFAIALLFIMKHKQVPQNVSQLKVSKKNAAEHTVAKQSALDGTVQLHLEGIDEILQSSDNQEKVFNRALSAICKQLEASLAIAYEVKKEGKYRMIEMFASFAHHMPEGEKVTYRFGEGLAGQAAKEGKLFNIKSVPQGYLQIFSGLGKATPTNLMIIPLKREDQVVGIVEIASFKEFSPQQEAALQESFDKLALKLVNNNNVSLAIAKS